MARKKENKERKNASTTQPSKNDKPAVKSKGVTKLSKWTQSGNAVRAEKVIRIYNMPEGMEEKELRDFYSQFGDIERVSVPRAYGRKRARGYGFVQFRYSEVAHVAAEATNNFMLFHNILKVSVIRRIWKKPAESIEKVDRRKELLRIKKKLGKQFAVELKLKEEANQRKRQEKKELNEKQKDGIDDSHNAHPQTEGLAKEDEEVDHNKLSSSKESCKKLPSPKLEQAAKIVKSKSSMNLSEDAADDDAEMSEEEETFLPLQSSDSNVDEPQRTDDDEKLKTEKKQAIKQAKAWAKSLKAKNVNSKSNGKGAQNSSSKKGKK